MASDTPTTQPENEGDLERFGLGPEDQDPTDETEEASSGNPSRDSSVNTFGLGPEDLEQPN